MVRRLTLAAAALIALALPAAAQTIVQDIALADGGSERVHFAGPANPRATLVLFNGGDGIVQIDDNGTIGRGRGNFLLRSEPLWLAQGFAVAILATPNGQPLSGQRHTASYADAILRAVDFARGRANVSVWLVGTSMGSIAAANGAAQLPGRVTGVVLTSSVAGPNRTGENVFSTNLGAIAVPALIVANRSDGCADAAPGFAPQILAALTRAPRKEIIYVDSSELRGDPCEAQSPHGYLGIEADVVRRISDWIRTASGR